MNRFLLLLLIAALPCAAQQPPAQPPVPSDEQQELRQAISEAGSSPVEFLRALENHLRDHPKTTQRAEIERAIVKTAIDSGDRRRLLQYGPLVLARDPLNAELLEKLARAHLAFDDPENARHALEYAQRLEQVVLAQPDPPAGAGNIAQFFERKWQTLGKARVYQARATGNLGKLPEAEALARSSYQTYPTAESAREIGRWLARQGKLAEAIQRTADAFAIADPAANEDERATDRAQMSEWSRKLNGSEAGLGDIVLAAWDRTRRDREQVREKLVAIDPNAGAEHPLDFVLAGLDGEKFNMATLKGKVVVLDFWATWCGPCRVQQPMYDQVKEHFKDNPGVVFLNISTDENHDIVKPFLAEMKWDKTVLFESGLGVLLRVSSIPTTIVINRRGEISSRMNGYVSDRFVAMLTERVNEALEDK